MHGQPLKMCLLPSYQVRRPTEAEWPYVNTPEVALRSKARPSFAEAHILERHTQYFTWCLYLFVKAAKTNYHKPSGLNSRNYFSHSCRGQESVIKVLAGWFLLRGCEKNISSWPLFLAYRWSSLYSNRVLPVCQSVSKCPHFMRTSITLD